MNITKLLQLLTEDRSIEHINKTFDKVPDSVKNILSSKMKKHEYDIGINVAEGPEKV